MLEILFLLIYFSPGVFCLFLNPVLQRFLFMSNLIASEVQESRSPLRLQDGFDGLHARLSASSRQREALPDPALI